MSGLQRGIGQIRQTWFRVQRLARANIRFRSPAPASGLNADQAAQSGPGQCDRAQQVQCATPLRLRVEWCAIHGGPCFTDVWFPECKLVSRGNLMVRSPDAKCRASLISM